MVRCLIIAFSLLLQFFCCAQPNFQKTYSGQGQYSPNAILQTIDGGYIIAGQVCKCGNNCANANITCKHIFVIKTNASGDTLWTRTYGDTLDDIPITIKQTSDGGYIIAGSTGSSPEGGQFFLLRLDGNGTILWLRSYFDNSGSLSIQSIELETDEGLAIACTLQTENALFFDTGWSEDVYLIRTDSLGNVVWEQRTNYTNQGYISLECTNLKQTFDGGYICTINPSGGATTYFSPPSIMKLNSIGDTLWTKSLSLGYNIINIFQTPDSGYFVEGCFYKKSGSPNGFICKMDKNGTSQWVREIANFGQGFSSTYPTTDGGFIITGSAILNSNQFSILKINSKGDSLWTKSYINVTISHSGIYPGTMIQQTKDKGFAFIVQTTSGFAVSPSLIKTDSLGNTECNNASATGIIDSSIANTNTPTHFNWSVAECLYGTPIVFAVGSGPDTVQTICSSTGINEVKTKNIEFIVFPNPSSNFITIQFPKQPNNPLFMQIMNLLGQTVLTQEAIQSSAFSIDVSTLPKSVYIAQIRDLKNGTIGRQKIVVQ